MLILLAIFLIAIGILVGRKVAAWLALIIAVIYGLAHSPVLLAIFLVVITAALAIVVFGRKLLDVLLRYLERELLKLYIEYQKTAHDGAGKGSSR